MSNYEPKSAFWLRHQPDERRFTFDKTPNLPSKDRDSARTNTVKRRRARGPSDTSPAAELTIPVEMATYRY